MNLAAIGIIFYIVIKLFDQMTGWIMLFFSAISVQFIQESHSIWQPHPLLLTMSMSLLCFVLAYEASRPYGRGIFSLASSGAKSLRSENTSLTCGHTPGVFAKGDKKRAFVWIIAGVFLYAVSCAIYPSPLLLLPFLIFITARCIQKSLSLSTGLNFVVAAAIVVVSLEILFSSVVIADWRQGALTPGISGLFNFPQYSSRVSTIGSAVFDLFSLILFVQNIFPQAWIPWISFGFLLWIVATIWIVGTMFSKKSQTRLFFAISLVLVLGFASLLLFPNKQYGYRLLVYAPFLLALLAFSFRTALHRGPALWRVMTILISALYIAGNLAGIYRSVTSAVTSDVKIARNIALFITRDRLARGIGKNSYMFDSLAYNSSLAHHYPIFPVLYMLWDVDMYRMPIVVDGNDVDRFVLDDPTAPYIYLLCQRFPTYAAAYESCAQSYKQEHADYRLESNTTFEGNSFLFTFKLKQKIDTFLN
ncbi:hypothetical protein HY031_02170 [Candidatus Gottesmanbacteria bacterium]|nr:hypothetical protein [Candidatus Gottesmanbacteria bacterium]